MLDALFGGELLQVVAGGEDGSGGAEHHTTSGVVCRGLLKMDSQCMPCEDPMLQLLSDGSHHETCYKT